MHSFPEEGWERAGGRVLETLARREEKKNDVSVTAQNGVQTRSGLGRGRHRDGEGRARRGTARARRRGHPTVFPLRPSPCLRARLLCPLQVLQYLAIETSPNSVAWKEIED
jgi:hypothetical protein